MNVRGSTGTVAHLPGDGRQWAVADAYIIEGPLSESLHEEIAAMVDAWADEDDQEAMRDA